MYLCFSFLALFIFLKVLLKDTSIYPTEINMFFILEPLFPYISIHYKIHLVLLIQHRSCINPSRILLSPLAFVAVMGAWQSPSHLETAPALGHPSGHSILQGLPKVTGTDLQVTPGRAVVFFFFSGIILTPEKHQFP